MDLNVVPSYIVSRPALVFTTFASILSFFALTPTPNLIAVAALLVLVRLSATTFVTRPRGYMKGAVQALCISIASGAAHLAPSVHALSTPNLALSVFSAVAFFASSFAVAIAFASAHISRTLNTSWAQLTLFPALWASAWGLMSKVSPVGQLVTWSPVLGLGPYAWIRQVLGQWGVDWLTAAWAVVGTELAGDYIVGASGYKTSLVDVEASLIDHVDVPQYIPTPQTSSETSSSQPSSGTRNLARGALLTVLLALMVPSYFISDLPPPMNAKDETFLGVGCALPRTKTGHLPTLKDFLHETATLQNQATIVFWPESALQFNSPEERLDALAEIQDAIPNHKYVGVSFEEFVPAGPKKTSDYRRNSFTLIGKKGPPMLEYDKRNLVPIAESFSLMPGTAPPDIFTISMRAPPGISGPDWAPGPNFTRPIPVTVSICLDFATASSFTSLPSRPALILAPAKTWHIGVGLAMWEQAKARAAETGSTVVWCDGGKGGISGIATGSYSEIVQVGTGSWVKRVSVHYPFDDRRTVYTWGGGYLAFLVVWGVMGVGSILQATAGLISFRRLDVVGYVGSFLSRRKPGVQTVEPSEETSLLG